MHATGVLKYTRIFQSPIPYIQEKDFGALCTLFLLF